MSGMKSSGKGKIEFSCSLMETWRMKRKTSQLRRRKKKVLKLLGRWIRKYSMNRTFLRLTLSFLLKLKRSDGQVQKATCD